jgi:hypothetical protein
MRAATLQVLQRKGDLHRGRQIEQQVHMVGRATGSDERDFLRVRNPGEISPHALRIVNQIHAFLRAEDAMNKEG